MRVFEIMTKGVQTVPAAMPVAEARELMRSKRIHHLVVTDNSTLAGVVSERDIAHAAGAGPRSQRRVGDVMTRPVVTARSEQTVRAVANLMRGRTIGCIPIVDGKRLVGIVTVSDLLTLLGRGTDRPAKPSRRTASHRVPHRKAHGFGMW